LSSNTVAKTSWQKHPLLFSKMHSLVHRHQKAHKTFWTKEGRVRALEIMLEQFLSFRKKEVNPYFNITLVK